MVLVPNEALMVIEQQPHVATDKIRGFYFAGNFQEIIQICDVYLTFG